MEFLPEIVQPAVQFSEPAVEIFETPAQIAQPAVQFSEPAVEIFETPAQTADLIQGNNRNNSDNEDQEQHHTHPRQVGPYPTASTTAVGP